MEIGGKLTLHFPTNSRATVMSTFKVIGLYGARKNGSRPMQQSRAKRSIIMIFRLLKKDQYRQATRLVSGLRSPFVDQSPPSLAAKGKIVLLTFWDTYKLNLQWKKTRRVSYCVKYENTNLMDPNIIMCCGIPCIFDFEHKRAILGRHHHCLIQDHIRPKKAPSPMEYWFQWLCFQALYSEPDPWKTALFSLNFPHCVPSFSEMSFLQFFFSVRISCGCHLCSDHYLQ